MAVIENSDETITIENGYGKMLMTKEQYLQLSEGHGGVPEFFTGIPEKIINGESICDLTDYELSLEIK